MPYYKHVWTAHEVPTDDKLNHIEEGIENATNAAESGGGAGLPEVTAADNGDVLTVVEGAWAKADAPSGGVFVVKFLTEDGETWTADKTFAEVDAANTAGKMIIGDTGETLSLGVRGDPNNFLFSFSFISNATLTAVNLVYNRTTGISVTHASYTLTPAQ